MSGASSVLTSIFIVSENGGTRRGVGGKGVRRTIDGMSMSAKSAKNVSPVHFRFLGDRRSGDPAQGCCLSMPIIPSPKMRYIAPSPVHILNSLLSPAPPAPAPLLYRHVVRLSLFVLLVLYRRRHHLPFVGAGSIAHAQTSSKRHIAPSRV